MFGALEKVLDEKNKFRNIHKMVHPILHALFSSSSLDKTIYSVDNTVTEGGEMRRQRAQDD
jgi:hypothetical protein